MELPLVPIEVVVEFVLPHAFDSFAQALELMLLCSDVYEFATSRCAFWEPFLGRRLDEVVIPRLQAAYHRYAPTLIHLLRTKYVMWPKSIMADETLDVMQAVRSKVFVVEQPYVLCVSCRGNGESPLVSIEFQEYHESDDEENEDEEAEAEAEESEADEEGDDDKREEEEEDVQEPQDEDEGEEPAEEVNEETKEGDGSKKPKHTKEHKMQLVVDNEMWCCKTCLERGFFFGFCDQCHTDPLVQARTEHAVAVGKRLRHDSTHLVEEWREGVDGVNRWDTEAPHPKLTFADAWADRKAYTPLFLLKLYSPTFTGYGSPSLFEGLIIKGCISHGIKYTGWKMEVHIYEGSFGEMEGFPQGKGRIEWASGVQFDGWHKMHALLGRKRCSFVFADGAKWEGQLIGGRFMFTSNGPGLLTLPDGRQIQCKAEAGRGRGGHCIHLWTEDGSEKYIVNRRLRGVVEPIEDEFEETDFEDQTYNEQWSDDEAAKDSDDNDDNDDDNGNDLVGSTTAPSSEEATPSTADKETTTP
ncbi:uncharacterized protein ACA1_261030 [Acanthamoeba castellanii str. Neff]|uniref:Uncharacterized protein n=1 Tax=Acanthamoeba castellanii (strain ATCC 30010 / Neff) TaxID=1257118 RepID=L8GF44_ACACF|nr:uncharacterized protein ACA1_261030 [Acanthamoeba castellanii str. Neff]ELR11695.1 hypothetical protein ACA1_261030 [Acanthamoeba castellanii str. Neff]